MLETILTRRASFLQPRKFYKQNVDENVGHFFKIDPHQNNKKVCIHILPFINIRTPSLRGIIVRNVANLLNNCNKFYFIWYFISVTFEHSKNIREDKVPLTLVRGSNIERNNRN